MSKSWKTGGCHCGAVRFRVRSDFAEAICCNCSMCAKKSYLHLIVDKADFELQSGKDALALYQFGTKTARHYFCRRCGIASFYVPRSHPEGYSVNLRCVDGVDLEAVRITPFDGRHWEQNVEKIR